MTDYIIYDLETQKLADQVQGGWSNIHGMGMASGVTYCSATDMYKIWNHDSKGALCEYLNNKLTISFNGIKFDSIVLLGNNRKIESNGATSNSDYKWFNLDLYVEIFRRMYKVPRDKYPELLDIMKQRRHGKGVFTLDAIVKNTIGTSKSGDGADAPLLFQQNRFSELYEYNLQDVRVLKQLTEFVLKYKYLVNGEFNIVQFK